MPTLSPRLQLIYDQLIAGKPVWDLCCDHGYLGLYAYHSGRFPEVHFVDQVPEIMQRLENRFVQSHQKADLHTQVKFWSVSAEALSTPLSGSIVIAGVGAYTVAKIVRSLNERGQLHAERLIFCPQNEASISTELTSELNETGFILDPEIAPVFERGRERKLLIFNKNSRVHG